MMLRAAVLAGVTALLVGGCDDTSEYDTPDDSSSTSGYSGNGGGSHGYHYDDTPDGRFNPSPPSGPYAP